MKCTGGDNDVIDAIAPVISVVLPVYNGEKYIAEAMESILCQTYRDFEFIVIDDGSTDGSLPILRKYRDMDSRIRLISRENRGLVATLNEGIDLARGEWIARMDADDISLLDRFEKQMMWLQKTGADICGGGMKLFGARICRTWCYEQDDDAIKLQLCFNVPFAHPTVVIRTELAQKHPYDRIAKHGEDYDLWTRLALAGARMTNVKETVLHYRVHAQQISRIHTEQQAISRERAQSDYIKKMVPDPRAFEVMNLFSTPLGSPSLEDATEMMEFINEVTWAGPSAKLRVFESLLKYVKPSTPAVYGLAYDFSQRLGVKRDFNLPLFTQTTLRLGSNGRIYDFLKQFV